VGRVLIDETELFSAADGKMTVSAFKFMLVARDRNKMLSYHRETALQGTL